MRLIPATRAYPWRTLDFDPVGADAFIRECRRIGVPYRFGGKSPQGKLGKSTPSDLLKAGGIDCSGLVRELLYQFSAGESQTPFPDGSWAQGDICRQIFKHSTVADAKKADGWLRAAVLLAKDSDSGVGHIALILSGMTMESHGSVGPNRRPWTGTGWQSKAQVYALGKVK